MKKTNNKVFKIILSIVLALLGIGFLVFYAIDPTNAKSLLKKVISFLNQPLPIVGFTVGAVLFFAWRVLVSTNYGKKIINALMEQLKKIKEEHEQYKIDSEKEKQELKAQNQELKCYIAHICELSTNKKIKDFGKGLLEYGEETSNSETKAE